MKKISDLGLTGKQSLLSGLGLIIFGFLLMLYGQQVPRLGYQLFFAYLFLSALLNLLMRWFRPKELRENLWLTVAKLILATVLANTYG